MKTTVLFNTISATIISLTVVFSAPAAPTQQPRQKRMTFNEISTRTALLQARADSLSSVLEQLRQDSVRAGQEMARQNSTHSKKLAEIEDALGKKRALATAAKTQYDKARQDSSAIIAKSREQMTGFRKELQQTGASLAALNNELELLIARQERIGVPSAGADDKAVLKLQSQLNQLDSLIRARQADIASLNSRREKLRQDSLQAETKRAAEADRFHQQIVRLDSEIATYDAAITQMEQKQASEKTEKGQRAARLQQNISLFTKQKQNADEQAGRLNAELSALAGERERIEQSSDAARLKYDQARIPYATASGKADTALLQAIKDKNVLIALRQKFSIDSAIFRARDVLDQAIQAEAEKKKGAKKLVEQRENELELLLQQQDSITRATHGLRQREAQFRASTNSQKTALVDSAISQSDQKITAATAYRDKARQSLSSFEQKNPKPQNTSAERITAIDSLIAPKKRAVILQTAISDSLNILLQEQQAETLSATEKGETGKTDSALQNKKNNRAELAAKRTKVQRDSAQNDAAAAMLKIKTEMTSVNNQILIAQNEATTFTADKDKARQGVLAIQEKGRQSQASMASEKKKTDSLAAAKQEEIARLSMKIEKLRKDSTTAVAQQDQQMRAISPSPASLAGLAATLDKELLALQKQRDSVTRTSLAGQTGSDAGKKTALRIAAVIRSIESTKSEIVAMNSLKEEASSRLKEEKIYYDSLLSATEQEVAGAITRRDKARQDSITAENNSRQSSWKVSAISRQHDSSIAVRQKELSDMTADYTRMVDDSKRSSEKTPSSLQGFSQSLKSIDEQIAAKEREIADLKAKKDKVKQDSIAESKRQAGLLTSVRAEIVKRSAAVEQKKAEVSLAIAEKKKALADTGSFQKKSMEAVAAATFDIRSANDRIENRRAELTRIQKELEAINARIRATSERGGGVTVTDEPAPKPAAPQTSSEASSKSPSSPAELAQKKTEEIYALLGENKIGEAAKKFRTLQQFFKTNLDADSFLALKTTIEQMGGSVK